MNCNCMSKFNYSLASTYKLIQGCVPSNNGVSRIGPNEDCINWDSYTREKPISESIVISDLAV